MHPAVTEGIEHFNSCRFFEAHEALESLWLKEQGGEKVFLHGLIQVAAAFHHYQRGNGRGFRSLLEKGVKKLTRYPETAYGIDVADFLQQIRPWLVFAQGPAPISLTPLPVIRQTLDRL